MIKKRLFIILVAICLPIFTVGQVKTFFSGQSGIDGDYIYADFVNDEGTRCIVSDAFIFTWPNTCSFSLIKLIPPHESTESVRYALAVETRDFQPKNAKLVIVCGNERDLSVVIMEQKSYASTSSFETKTSLSLTPFAMLGNGLGLSMLLSNKEQLSETQAFYGVYEVSLYGLDFILDRGISEMRVPTRSKYVSYTGIHRGRNGFLTWLETALSNVDRRSFKSVNTIEDDIVASTP